ncbi:alpha/beta hydrolase-fold protein [Botrimarina hoheduenensis]|uniref:Alpha/beta hydrolase family protein n=1 Tax=Botrimarina hoheduenensis TaxID=2528000 RepID=A0A5C5W8F5_9BACT|nr:alpha/beta hydrolase-fold protein [Botrimarina hoheduenensis]TWT46737.1 hypothetical protein Pla111_18380 [Botrimarina hoheduenensis]
MTEEAAQSEQTQPEQTQSEQTQPGPAAEEAPVAAGPTGGVNEESTPTAEPEKALPPAVPATPLEPSEWLVLPRVGDYRRQPLHADPVESAWIKGEDWPPHAGTTLPSADGRAVKWRAATADDTGATELIGGYAYAEFECAAPGIYLLDARGVAAVLLNDQWVVGDPYRTDRFRPPVPLLAGKNRVLLHLAEGGARVRFELAPTSVFWRASSAMLPDGVAGEERSLVGSLLLVNPLAKPLDSLSIAVAIEGSASAPQVEALPSIGPLAVYPVGLAWKSLGELAPGEHRLRVTLSDGEGESLAETTLPWRVIEQGAVQTASFVSRQDATPQPYVIAPPRDKPLADPTTGIVLLLHDAGQSPAEAVAELGALAGWAIVAPSGRGPYGFDWQAWSEADALEALDDCLLRINPRRKPSADRTVVVAGRGMGGHGALSLAVAHPDRFAAAVIDEGWLSHASVGRTPVVRNKASALEQLLARPTEARNPLNRLSNTRAMALGVGVSQTARSATIEQARQLRGALGTFHPLFSYREGLADEGGLNQLLTQTLASLPPATADEPDEIDFSVPGGDASSSVAWVTLVAPQQEAQLSQVKLRRDPATHRVSGTTDNVREIELRLAEFAGESTVVVTLDQSAEIQWKPTPRSPTLRLERDKQDRWGRARTRWDNVGKNPQRPGGLRSAFMNRPLLVYGTRGTEEENAWCEAKARYDAQTFLYRGAGRLDVIADRDFSFTADPGRNLVFYGNESINSASRFWMQLAPTRVQSGLVEVWPTREKRDARPESGDDLTVLHITPRPDLGQRFGGAPAQRQALLAMVGGTGLKGLRGASRLRYFWSGVEYPDLLVFSPLRVPGESEKPSPAEGAWGVERVHAAGYYSQQWRIPGGEILWREPAL